MNAETTLRGEYGRTVENISIADMPNDDMLCVAQECGLEVAKALLNKMSGASIIVPRRRYNKIADKFIIRKFDGKNAKTLASACGYSLRNVYRVIEKEDRRRERKHTTKNGSTLAHA